MSYQKGSLFALVNTAAPQQEVAVLLRDHALDVGVEEYAQASEESVRRYPHDHHVFAFVLGGLISSAPSEDDVYRILRRGLHIASSTHNDAVLDYVVAGISKEQKLMFSDAIADALFVAGSTFNRHALATLTPLCDEVLGVIEALRNTGDNEAADVISQILHVDLGQQSTINKSKKM